MATEFKLPELGEGVEEADVARIYVAEGDEIASDDAVMELETEKAATDLPCPHAGKVAKIHVSEGDTIKVGQTLLSIEEAEQGEEAGDEDKEKAADAKDKSKEKAKDAKEKKEKPDDKKEEEAEQKEADREGAEEKDDGEERDEERDEEEREQADDVEESPAEEKRVKAAEAEEEPEDEEERDDDRELPPRAGPATRRLARQLDVDLDSMQPADRERITQQDVVRAFLESGKVGRLLGGGKALPDFEKFGPVERQPLNKIARTSAERLTIAWQMIPQVTQHGVADISELEPARREFLESRGEGGPKITLTSLAIKAVTAALHEFPKFNSSFDAENGELILKRYVHVGIAVDTEQGLLVPVIRDADRKSIREIAAEIDTLADKARQKSLSREQMEGATFTVSNQGGIGGGEFTPLVNWPEVAILGLARARRQLEMIDGRPQERLKLPLSLSYDHRVINGADAARFIERIAAVLADSFTLLVNA